MTKDTLTIENAKIVCRNFSGKPEKFNPDGGRRNFLVVIDPDIVDDLRKKGWNVKQFRPRDNGDPGDYYIKVTVRFDKVPPSIFLVTKKNKIRLYEDTIDQLDWAEIDNVDLIISGVYWELATGQSGLKAYVKTMYVTVAEDDFADKYNDI